MQHNEVVRKAIINTAAASGANVLSVAASGPYPGAVVICADNTATQPVEYLPPITKGTCAWATKTVSQAENPQVAIIGMDTEVIVASTRYKIEIGSFFEKYESYSKLMGVYAYTSPATLSGTAQTDRDNVYTVLNTKINADSRNHVTSYLLYKVAFTLGGNAGGGAGTDQPVPGTTITQATSSVTAVIGAVEVTSGTWDGDDAAGNIYLYNVSAVGSWLAASTASTYGTNGTLTTAAALAINGLAIVDDAGYFPAYPQTRKGFSNVMLTDGFATAQVDVGIRSTDTLLTGTATGVYRGEVGTYAIGIGSDMATRIPSWNETKDMTVTGDARLQLNATPDTSKTYTLFRIAVDVSPTDNVLTHYGGVGPFIYEVWVNEDSGRTNVDAFETALESALGVTIA
jgi:hypothetical protein